MKTIDYSYFIEKYIAGEMDQTEKIWFEKELAADKSLQQEVNLRRKTDKILERQDIISLRNKLASIEKQRALEKESRLTVKAPRFRYAAVITGLIIIGSLLFTTFNKPSLDEIYSQNFQPGSQTSVPRSASGTYDEALEYYYKGEFEKARIGFQAFLSANPGSSRTEFLMGLTNMELKNFLDAEDSFNNVINKEGNLYIDEANWFLAGCYVATEDIIMAKKQLRKIAKSESRHNKEAKSLLRKL